jgi:hypothetical protein
MKWRLKYIDGTRQQNVNVKNGNKLKALFFTGEEEQRPVPINLAAKNPLMSRSRPPFSVLLELLPCATKFIPDPDATNIPYAFYKRLCPISQFPLPISPPASNLHFPSIQPSSNTRVRLLLPFLAQPFVLLLVLHSLFALSLFLNSSSQRLALSRKVRL